MAKLGVIHYNFPALPTLSQFLQYAADTGFSFVELQWRDVGLDEVDDPEAVAEKVRQEVEALGLQVSALAAGNDFVLLDESMIQEQVARMATVCKLAQILGAPVVRTEGGRPKSEVPEERHVEAMAECLRRCAASAEEFDVRLAVDNHGLVTNDGDLEVALFQAVDSPYVGANIDTMNYRWAGHSVAEVRRFVELVAPYCFHTHLKDGTGSRGGYVGAVLGEGEIDLPHAVSTLRAAGYDGVWCAEYEGREETTLGYAKCLDWMKANL